MCFQILTSFCSANVAFIQTDRPSTPSFQLLILLRSTIVNMLKILPFINDF